MTGEVNAVSRHLSPQLQEVCVILAVGLVRLRRHTLAELACDAKHTADEGESSLHKPAM